MTAGMVLALLATATAAAQARAGDPHRPLQWGLDRIEVEAAWERSSGSGTTIAIVSTGTALAHPDLRPKLRVLPGADFVACPPPRTAPCADPDGPDDPAGPGTWAAGVAAAATGNGQGVAGVAPKARLLPVRVTDGPLGTHTRPGAAGIAYAAAHGADVVHVGFTVAFGDDIVTGLQEGTYDPTVVPRAVQGAWDAGATIVAAAGELPNPSSAGSKAVACMQPGDHPAALCVGSTDFEDRLVAGTPSDVGLRANFLVAPATDSRPEVSDDSFPSFSCAKFAFTTMLYRDARECPGGAGWYGYVRGVDSGIAAAHVAGVAALLHGAGFDNCTVMERILSTADDLGAPGRDSIYGYGRVNARRALTDDHNLDPLTGRRVAVALPAGC